jgi:hypothetical protein
VGFGHLHASMTGSLEAAESWRTEFDGRNPPNVGVGPFKTVSSLPTLRIAAVGAPRKRGILALIRYSA